MIEFSPHKIVESYVSQVSKLFPHLDAKVIFMPEFNMPVVQEQTLFKKRKTAASCAFYPPGETVEIWISYGLTFEQVLGEITVQISTLLTGKGTYETEERQVRTDYLTEKVLSNIMKTEIDAHNDRMESLEE